jgi:hypothetical protein
MTVSITGQGERQDTGFERIVFRFNGTIVARGDSAGGGRGCGAAPVRQQIVVPGPYIIPALTSATFNIDFTTGDPFFHVGAFYQVDLTFVQV